MNRVPYESIASLYVGALRKHGFVRAWWLADAFGISKSTVYRALRGVRKSCEHQFIQPWDAVPEFSMCEKCGKEASREAEGV